MTDIADMAIQFLRDLIRFDTTNPPGNELPAAQYIADLLRREDIETSILEAAPGRGSVVARLRGDGSQGALLLMSHLDVVAADAQEWEHPPFAADVVDGYVWGRGTTDTKQLTAMQMAILLTLKRQDVPLRRDVVLAATADEESGAEMGMKWLVENHAELLDCQYALNEGGGFGLDVGKQRFYMCQTGEKGVCWMKLTARGTPGHGAVPQGDNAVAKLSAALARLSQARLPQHRTATVDRLVHSVAAAQGLPQSAFWPLVLNPLFEQVVLRNIESRSEIASALGATLHNTATPTMLRAGTKTNVIPSEASAQVDGRLVPGQQPQDLLHEMRPYIGDEIEVQFLTPSQPYESDPASPLFDLLQQVVEEHDPGSKVVPFIVPGGTDARFLAARGVKVYGFSPARQEPGWKVLEMAHVPNERISLSNVEFGTQVLYDVVRRFCT